MFIVISFIAAFLTTFSFVPQAIKVIKTKNTEGISLNMYTMFTVGVMLWLVYGISANELAIVLANAVTLVFASIIWFYTFKHEREKNR
jgi:MtN3 and saliva related transmembrane protein